MSSQTLNITIEIAINKSIDDVWEFWITPADIEQWNNPFENWHCPRVENDLTPGGSFLYRMEAKDGSGGFDHSGIYDKVLSHQLIEYKLSDGRRSIIQFISDGDTTRIIETFEPEKGNSLEMQKYFCQSVLNNFKKYAEQKGNDLHNGSLLIQQKGLK